MCRRAGFAKRRSADSAKATGGEVVEPNDVRARRRPGRARSRRRQGQLVASAIVSLPAEQSGVGEGRVGAVQEPELPPLVGLDVGDDLDADLVRAVAVPRPASITQDRCASATTAASSVSPRSVRSPRGRSWSSPAPCGRRPIVGSARGSRSTRRDHHPARSAALMTRCAEHGAVVEEVVERGHDERGRRSVGDDGRRRRRGWRSPTPDRRSRSPSP